MIASLALDSRRNSGDPHAQGCEAPADHDGECWRTAPEGWMEFIR